ncbi:MAG: glucuronate isomerase [Bryobacterales bacterium]|nr:glucuronate isomerase [Bryobacterales bacterium]
MPASVEAIPLTSAEIRLAVQRQIDAVPFIDLHTHLFSPALGKLGLWGIDELVTYHYLEAELFRSCDVPPDQYWRMDKRQRADLIWKTLFVENTPVSEATRGVVAVLSAFGLSSNAPDLREARQFFEAQTLNEHITRILKMSGVSEFVMTNDPLDPEEGPLWEAGIAQDPRFHAVLRLDRILNRWSEHWQAIAAKGYAVEDNAGGGTPGEIRRFLHDWAKRMSPVYMAVSLPDTFQYPDASVRGRLLAEAVIPACQDLNVPLSLMIGVRYQVNPALRLAGDGVGKADLRALERICVQFPSNRFLVSVLSRENQHELCVYARKFRNMLPFGCWWFLNNPSIVEEMTRERIEMLGASFVPQHSDARVLEQVIYKWKNTRRTLAPVLAATYQALVEDGREVTETCIRNDVTRLFRTNFEKWVGLR